MKRILVSRWFHIFVLLTLLGGAVFVRAQDYSWAQSLRFLAFDAFNRFDPRPPTDDVVVVDIDETSLGRPNLGQWPWSRLVIARLIENLKEKGATAIVFDMVFAEEDRTSPHAVMERLPADANVQALRDFFEGMPDNDEVLAQTIGEAGNVVTAFIWSSNMEATRRAPVLSQPILMTRPARTLLDSVPAMTGVATNLPLLSQAAAGNGSFGVTPEVDGIIRRVPLFFNFEDPQRPGARILYPSLAAEAVRVAQGAKLVTRARTLKPEEAGPFDPPLKVSIGKYEVPLDWDGRLFVYFSQERRKDYIPAWQVIDGSVADEKIKGKIVFVGTSAEGLKDLRSTPLDLFVSGVELHVNVAEQILTGHYLTRPKLVEGVELLVIGFVGLMIIVIAPFIGAVLMAAITLLMIGAISFVSWLSFKHYGLLLDPVYPSLCIVVLFVMSALFTYIRTEAERRRVRQAFGLYISPDFMEELAKNPDKLSLGGQTRELTVMFTDIRSFTTISESLSPEALIQLMNEFLTPMSDLVMNNRGTIDKYMGDAMMAFWNAPLDDPDHARHACQAALQMNKALEPINETLRVRAESERKPPLVLKAGIGINTGTASVGNMGSRQRFAYSAIGDTVNLASRLEGQTKYYGASILIGAATQARIPDFAALEMDLIRVKGKMEPVRVFSLLGDDVYAAQDFFAPWRSAHEEMMASYRAGDFTEAEKMIARCFDLAGGRLKDFYALYEERLANLRQNPPGGAWDGVYTATSK